MDEYLEQEQRKRELFKKKEILIESLKQINEEIQKLEE